MDTLYSGKNEEIYRTFTVHTTNVEHSHLGSAPPLDPRQLTFQKAVQEASAIASLQIESFDIRNSSVPITSFQTDENGFKRVSKIFPKVEPEPPKFLSAMTASQWSPNYLNVDVRPRIWDKNSKQFLLIDSGAATTIIPPQDGDKIDTEVNSNLI